MHHLSRFGVSLEEDLLAAFDFSIGGMGYQNRSEAIRDLIRDHLIQKKVGQGDAQVIGVVTLVYDHRIHHLRDVLADTQHKASVAVNASLHIHLDEHNCLEVIVIRGRADKVHEIASKLTATKGVQNGKLVTTTSEMKH
ncbi:MAG: nickel-responsive transcriptional regulator NikR [Deltaproteobacteria bacterium]|nr:nickel-responsive transcriptional regulator NikR [Deltaproteobacteria bacterium]